MASSPLGRPTRGTTGTNRLRRNDRWIAASPPSAAPRIRWSSTSGYGASGVTAFELATRLQRVRAGCRGARPRDRPAHAWRQRPGSSPRCRPAAPPFSPDLRVSFARGGFEVPLPAGRRPAVIRAMNVLRQYDEADVAEAWRTMAARLAPDGLLVEGTCDEIGRVSSWIDVGPDGSAAAVHDLAAPGRSRAPEHRRRATAQGADPSERPGRAGARAARRSRPRVGPSRTAVDVRGDPAIPRRRRRRCASRAGRCRAARAAGGSASSPCRGRRSRRWPDASRSDAAVLSSGAAACADPVRSGAATGG